MLRNISITITLLALSSACAYGMKFHAYNGDVEFDHRFHRLKFECKDCHDGPPQHFELDHVSGHKLCIGCHRKVQAGPIKHCSDCHKVS